MKRHWLITTVTTIQFVLALVLAGLAVFVFLQTRSPQILSEPDAKDAIRGLEIGALALALPGLIYWWQSTGCGKQRFGAGGWRFW
jgi:hypothetical protein